MSGIAEVPIAIVGLACRLPGADDLDEFWDLLISGRSGLGELPPERFNKDLFYQPRRATRAQSYTSLGGATRDLPFDSASTLLSRSVFERSHEVHLKLLEVAAAACRHAGLDRSMLEKRNVGVYVGHTPPGGSAGRLIFARQVAHTARYLRSVDRIDQLLGGRTDEVIQELVAAFRDPFTPDHPDIRKCANAYHASGLLTHAFRLSGPSMAFDAACASSLRALVHGARALQLGQIEMAIVGGASYVDSDCLVVFSQAQSLSPTGSRPFDHTADGLIASEGYAVVCLKTLESAVRDGDSIHAVIRGIGVSSDGKGKSLWAPRKEGQIKAIERAYCSGLSVQDMQYIEMHATSTPLGDATEAAALAETFGETHGGRSKIPVGSVKANVGHTLETAGLASLVKTVLAMRHGIIPPQINIERLNPAVDWEKMPFYVPMAATAWPASDPDSTGRATFGRCPDRPRRAAVNAFGIGGLNVHVVLEEHQPGSAASAAVGSPPKAIVRGGHRERESIAIVGAGLILPGVRTIDALWPVVCSGQIQIGDVPPARWDASLAYQPGRAELWKVPTKVGGFITDFEYDWKRHKVPPKQVASADPLQFMLLDAADQAFREAGYDQNGIDRTRTGVVVGTIFCGEFTDQLQAGLHLPQFTRNLEQMLRGRGVPTDAIDHIASAYEEILLGHMPALIDETGSFTASTLASRITKTLDLMGGAVAVDAGDASSAAALNCCIDLLRAGDCDLMICAGGHRAMGIVSYESMLSTGLLAEGLPKGPFSADADGCVPGEGVGVVLLKRLSDARRDGDNIRGIIRGIGAAWDESLEKSVQTSIERAFDDAGIGSTRVSVLETASSGVSRNDRQELSGIQSTYGSEVRTERLQIGTTAGQFGNLGGASTTVALLKAVSELNHTEMPGQIGTRNPLPDVGTNGRSLSLDESPQRLFGLSAGEDKGLLAGVNSYSQLNISYHILVEGMTHAPLRPQKSEGGRLKGEVGRLKSEAGRVKSEVGRVKSEAGQVNSPAIPRTGGTVARAATQTETRYEGAAVSHSTLHTSPFTLRTSTGEHRIVRIGAESRETLVSRASRLAEEPADAYASAESQQFAPTDLHRLAVVSADPAELAQKLKLAARHVNNPAARPVLNNRGIFYHESQPSQLAFVFPGLQSQYDGMLRQLVREFSPAADALRTVDDILEEIALPSFERLAWTGGERSGNGRSQNSPRVRTLVTLASANYIVQQSSRAVGLEPAFVAGHGLGELSALVAAGSIALRDALVFAKEFSTAVDACPRTTGTMLATTAPPSILPGLCRQLATPVFVSQVSAAGQTAVVGDASAVHTLAERLRNQNHLCSPPRIVTAVHTPLMGDVLARLRDLLAAVHIEPPSIPFLSSLRARFLSEPDEIRDDFVSLMTEPVDYEQLLARLTAENAIVLLEVGPGAILTRLHERHFTSGSFSGFSCDHPKRPGLQQLLYARACVETTGAVEAGRNPHGLRFRSSESHGEHTSADRSAPAVKPGGSSAHGSDRHSRDKIDGLNVLRLEGSPYQMGLQQGLAQSEQLADLLSHTASHTASHPSEPIGVTSNLDAAMAQPDVFFGPAGTDELRGLADGSGIAFDALVAHNLRLYSNAGAGGLHFALTADANRHADGLLHCVNEELPPEWRFLPTVADSDDRSAENFDGRLRGKRPVRPLPLSAGGAQERFVHVRSPEQGRQHVTFGVAGQVGGLNGINAAGIAVTTSALLDVPLETAAQGGRLLTVLVKEILEHAGDINSALSIIRESRCCCPYALMLSRTSEDRLCYVEFDGNDLKVQPAPASVVTSNHRLMRTLAGQPPESSRKRLGRLTSLLGDELTFRELSVQQAQSILRDRTEDGTAPHASHATSGTVCSVNNQMSLVMQPARGLMWLATHRRGDRRCDSFQAIPLQQLLSDYEQQTAGVVTGGRISGLAGSASQAGTAPPVAGRGQLSVLPGATGVAGLPLIDSVKEFQRCERLTAEIHLDPRTDVFLLDHRYKGVPMMPVVVTMEAVAEAAALLFEGTRHVVALRDVEILDGLRLHTDETRIARIEAVAHGNEVTCTFTSDFRNRSGKLLLEHKPYLKATVELADPAEFRTDKHSAELRLNEPPVRPPEWPSPPAAAALANDEKGNAADRLQDKPPVRRPEWRSLPAAAASASDEEGNAAGRLRDKPPVRRPPKPDAWGNTWYSQRDMSISHGPAFQALRHLASVGDDDWGRLVAPDVGELAGSRQGEGWVSPPAALDACFFACGSFVWFRYGVVAIPKRIERVCFVRQPYPGETCLVHLKSRGRTEDGAIFDFTMYGDNDAVLLHLDGYQNMIVAEVPAEAR